MTFRSRRNYSNLCLRPNQPITDVISAILVGKSILVMSEGMASMCECMAVSLLCV